MRFEELDIVWAIDDIPQDEFEISLDEIGEENYDEEI